MKRDTMLFGIIGLLAGIVITAFAAGQAVNNDNRGMMRMMGMDSSTHHGDAADHDSLSMDEMTEQLKDKTGDDFDEAFIEMMVAHHQGAIDMAELIPSRAKHDEIKALGEAIIEAQTKEISDMYKWRALWGYDPGDTMHGH